MTDEGAEKIADALESVALAVREAFGRDHGDIGFVGEIANGLISIGSALRRLADVAERWQEVNR